MDNLEYKQEDFKVSSLGESKIPSPLGLSTTFGDDIVNYVNDTSTILLDYDSKKVVDTILKGKKPLFFEMAAPRHKIYFDSIKTRVAIVTCGGLCPGINNVIRTLVNTLYYHYSVKKVFGIPYGYQGFISKYNHEPLILKPDNVNDFHQKGGSMLGSSRGHQSVAKIVDCLVKMNISILFTIGGDGTLAGANEIYEEITKRQLKISVIGIPKTIDNDISFVQKTFGLETAFEIAAQAIHAAHTEAKGAPNGIGIVKVMGRLSGFIAAHAALALPDVNFVFIPEVPFDLEGEKGFFKVLEDRLKIKNHAVIIIAEGAGQRYVLGKGSDASGNRKLGDIGLFLKKEIKSYFKEKINKSVNIKYIDPSYMIRAVPANAHDSIYCVQLAQNAVHAAMAGKTGMIIGMWNDQFTHVPIRLAVSQRKTLSPESTLWQNVLSETGQPISMVND